MEILYALNIAVAILAIFWPVWFSRRTLRLPLINPLTIVMAIGLPVQLFKLIGGPVVLIDDGLFDPNYQFALLMSNVQVALQTLGLLGFYWWFKSIRAERYMPFQRALLGRKTLARAEYIFLVLFGGTYLLLAVGDFGLAGWLMNPREGYQLHRAGQGQWYALATTFLGVAFLLSFLARPVARSILRNTFLYIFLSYFLGSKGTMLAIFGSSLIFLWFIGWKHLRKMLIVGTPLILALMILNLFLAMSDGFGIQTVLEYFDYFKNAADYYRAYFSGQLHLFHGEIFSSNFWAYVPRAVWPDKPSSYGILLVNEVFFPGQAEATNTPAFGGAVEQFADFGLFGVIAFSLFSTQSIVTACFSYLTFRRPGISVSRVTLSAVGLMVVQFAPMFGAYFPALLYLTLLGFVLLVVGLLRQRSVRNRASLVH